MLAKRRLDKGNKSICIGQKERDTGTFLFNSVLKKKKKRNNNHKVNRKYFEKGKNR